MKKASRRALRWMGEIAGLYIELAQSAARLVPGRS